MNFPDQLRERKVQLVEAPINKDAFGVEHCAHCAISENNSRLQLFAELGNASLYQWFDDGHLQDGLLLQV